jgi:hypothetical protein
MGGPVSEKDQKTLEDRINRMNQRIERLVSMKGEIDSLVAEAHTDVAAMKLQLNAERYAGREDGPTDK